jgi:hypothetical protein
MVPVARDQGVSHQGRTVAFTLLRRVDAEERQVPVRFTRVIAIHLLEDPGDLLLNPFGRRALHERDQGVLVRVDIGREPESGPRVTVDTVGGLVRKRAAAERSDEGGEVTEVLLRVRPRPSRGRVGTERQYHRADGGIFIGCLGRPNKAVHGRCPHRQVDVIPSETWTPDSRAARVRIDNGRPGYLTPAGPVCRSASGLFDHLVTA